MRLSMSLLNLLLVLTSPCVAIEPSTAATFKKAQEYGVLKANVPYQEFAESWMVYEENAQALNDTAERAYVFTPFLLVANDARGKSINGEKIVLTDSEKVLKDYAGCMVFSAIFFGDTPDFMKDMTCTLQQGGKYTIIKAYHISVPAQALAAPWYPKSPQYMGQCYFYYKEKDIKLDNPAILTVHTVDNMDHRFYFDLAKIR